MCGCGIELPCAGICSCGCDHDWETSYAEWRKAKTQREEDIYGNGMRAGLQLAVKVVEKIDWIYPHEHHGGYMEDDHGSAWIMQSTAVDLIDGIKISSR